MLDQRGRKRALTKYERKRAQIEGEFLRQTYSTVAIDESEDERPILCNLHGWRGPESRSDGVVVQAWGAAGLCPGCEADRNEAEARRLAPPPTDVLPAQGRNPTPVESSAWDNWKTEHRDELLRSRPHLVEPQLERDAVARMTETHRAAKAEARLTVEEKMQRRARSHQKYWGKRVAAGLDPSLLGLSPRDFSDEVVITFEDEKGRPIELPEPQRRYDPEDDWPRDVPRSFLSKWFEEQRRSSWLPRRSTPIQEKVESLTDKIGAAIRSVLSEPGEESNDGAAV
jgi:hypothetical protein